MQVIPNTFIIGAPKCGTTSLYTYLSAHPGIFFAPIKEPKHWSPDIPNPAFLNKSLDEYLQLFRAARSQHRIVGEASTSYLASAVALEQILAFNSNARVIAIVRNPLSLLPAYHMELCLTFHEDVENFETAWRLQPQRRQNQSIPEGCAGALRLDYKWAASFGRQIQRLFVVVPEPQRMVICFDDLVTDTKAVYEQVLRFLNVESDHRTAFPQVHASRQYRLRLLRRLWIRPPNLLAGIVDPLRRTLGADGLNISRFVERLLTRTARRPGLRREFEDELSAEFTEEVRLLGQLIERNLDHWLTERVT